MKDSVGNPMPNREPLHPDATLEELGKAISLQIFIIAAESALRQGLTVIYSAKEKTATISGNDKFQSQITHE